jgi:ribosomal protein L29
MKASEVRAMREEELKLELGKLRTKLYDLRAKRVSESVEDTSQFAKLRGDIARMLTEQTARNKSKAAKA